MPDRVILHCDMNNCYASIEMAGNPKLRGVPLAVGGDAAERHGIILARSYEARAFGIKVGMALWQARQLCPKLVIVQPNYALYLRYSKLLRDMLKGYSELVEPFGLDEMWVDVTGCTKNFGVKHITGMERGKLIADEIRQRVKGEMGVTVSVGVSWNKIFAKLGSDMKKPNATTVITRENFKETVWPLPASDLLGVGRRTLEKLVKYGFFTIGDIACASPVILQRRLGKWGLFLNVYAAGDDVSQVSRAREGEDYAGVIKTVGNSTTCPRDLVNEHDCLIVFTNLAESVAERMREIGMMARTVEISLRTNDLHWFTRQTKLPRATHVASELTRAAMRLMRENFSFEKPLRSIGIRGCELVPLDIDRQTTMFEDERRCELLERVEFAVDDIRRRFGHAAISRALLASDARLGRLNPKEDHVIHPIGYLG